MAGALAFAAGVIAFISGMLIDSVGLGVDGDTGALTVALSAAILKWHSFLGLGIPLPNLEWVTSIYQIATWDFYFFNWDAGTWVRAMVALVVWSGILWGFFRDIAPVLGSILGAVASAIGSVTGGLIGALGRLAGV